MELIIFKFSGGEVVSLRRDLHLSFLTCSNLFKAGKGFATWHNSGLSLSLSLYLFTPV